MQSKDKTQTKPAILIIIGITGDLSHRKLLPAIERLSAAGELPKQFKLVGVSRRDVGTDEVVGALSGKPRDHAFIRDHLEMIQMDLQDENDYKGLKKRLKEIEKELGSPAQRLFHLSVPPQFSEAIIKKLGQSGLSKAPNTKLLLEKPFGSDLASAKGLVEDIRRYFKESQVYRIDHYLAKEMAQNILTFRRENPLFRRTWSKDFIKRIEIVAAEDIGIEGRVTFYEHAGALGDFVQSHLLQLAAITLMDLPLSAKWKDVPELRLGALKALHTPSGKELKLTARRAQYKGYAKEVDKPDTKTETFVSLKMYSDDPRWDGVPIKLTTGKALDRKHSEIRLFYHREDEREANELILHIQPREGIELKLWSKKPGYDRQLERVQLAFHYRENEEAPQPYEQVFLSAIQGDQTLFTSHEEVLASWRVLEPVQKLWRKDSEDLVGYESGHWPRFKS